MTLHTFPVKCSYFCFICVQKKTLDILESGKKATGKQRKGSGYE
jgi:hypothetical protein